MHGLRADNHAQPWPQSWLRHAQAESCLLVSSMAFCLVPIPFNLPGRCQLIHNDQSEKALATWKGAGSAASGW